MEERMIISGKKSIVAIIISITLITIGSIAVFIALMNVMYALEDLEVENPGVLFIGGIGLLIWGFVVGTKDEIIVTDKRVYGKKEFAGARIEYRRMDLPLESIKAVGILPLQGIVVANSSGKIRFHFISNYREIHQAVCRLILDKNGKQESGEQTAKGKRRNTDDLQKYKDWLDYGVITQEEFDKKKEQLLNL